MKKLIGAVFFVVLMAGFGGAGVTAILRAAHAWRQSDLHEFFHWLPFAILFTPVGLVFLATIPMGIKHYRKESRLKAEHPGRPWMWNEQWAKGEIWSSPYNFRLGMVVFMLVISVILVPETFNKFWDSLTPHQELAAAILAALCFAALLSYAVLVLRRILGKASASFLTFSAPGRVGGLLQGVVNVPLSIPNTASAKSRLVCSRLYSGVFGEHSKELWQSDPQTVPGTVRPGSRFVEFPISVAIPADCPPTNTASIPPMQWHLYLWTGPEAKYTASFSVPVFTLPS